MRVGVSKLETSLLTHFLCQISTLFFFCVKVCRECAHIFIAAIIQRWCRRNNLQARTALCVDCTNVGFAFLASPYPQLLSHMYFALVQLLVRRSVCKEFALISIAVIIGRWWRRNNLQARTALCVDCTNVVFAFLASPFPQLLSHM